MADDDYASQSIHVVLTKAFWEVWGLVELVAGEVMAVACRTSTNRAGVLPGLTAVALTNTLHTLGPTPPVLSVSWVSVPGREIKTYKNYSCMHSLKSQ